MAHRGDNNDPYLPLMYWYGIEELVPRFGKLTEDIDLCRFSLVRQLVSRRVVETYKTAPETSHELFDELLRFRREAEVPFYRDVLRGVQDGLIGRRNLKSPKSWEETYSHLIESPLPEVRERALALAVQFGDQRAFTLLRKIVPDREQPLKEREAALKALLFQQKADLVPILHELLGDPSLRGAAIRGLAAFDHADTPGLLLKGYAKWTTDEKADVIQTLSSRARFAQALVAGLEDKSIPRGDINSYTIRQLHTVAAKDPATLARLTKLVGEVRPASADKAKLMAKYKDELKPDVLKRANLANGRALYNKACANCHRLFGEGGDIGPDLTGSQRTNLDYVLENVLDPSAIVPREYQVTVVETKQGRTLSGIVKKESDAAITLQLQNELVVVPKGDIESRVQTKQSMMPEGIFEPMRLEEVRDLVGYLASPVQVALTKK